MTNPSPFAGGAIINRRHQSIALAELFANVFATLADWARPEECNEIGRNWLPAPLVVGIPSALNSRFQVSGAHALILTAVAGTQSGQTPLNWGSHIYWTTTQEGVVLD